MKNNMRFVLTLIKIKLSHMMVFRLAFFEGFFVDTTLFLIQILMYQAIYTQVDTIGGWSRGEMIIFIGTFSLINALNMCTFFFGTIEIPEKIKSGNLDHYITKPVNPLLRLSFENVNPGSMPLVFLSIILISYGIKQLDIRLSAAVIMIYILFVLLMTLLWYDLMVIVRCIPFFTVSADQLARMSDTTLELCMKLPGTLFHGIFKLLFYLILPYGIMSTFPSQFILGKLTLLEIAYGFIIVLLFTIFTLWFWRFGLKHYKSASS